MAAVDAQLALLVVEQVEHLIIVGVWPARKYIPFATSSVVIRNVSCNVGKIVAKNRIKFEDWNQNIHFMTFQR